MLVFIVTLDSVMSLPDSKLPLYSYHITSWDILFASYLGLNKINKYICLPPILVGTCLDLSNMCSTCLSTNTWNFNFCVKCIFFVLTYTWKSQYQFYIFFVICCSGEVPACGSSCYGWRVPSLLTAAELHTFHGLPAPHCRGKRWSLFLKLISLNSNVMQIALFKCCVSYFQRWENWSSIDTVKRRRWTGWRKRYSSVLITTISYEIQTNPSVGPKTTRQRGQDMLLQCNTENIRKTVCSCENARLVLHSGIVFSFFFYLLM